MANLRPGSPSGETASDGEGPRRRAQKLRGKSVGPSSADDQQFPGPCPRVGEAWRQYGGAGRGLYGLRDDGRRGRPSPVCHAQPGIQPSRQWHRLHQRIWWIAWDGSVQATTTFDLPVHFRRSVISLIANRHGPTSGRILTWSIESSIQQVKVPSCPGGNMK